MRYHVDLTTPEAVARQLNTVNPDGSVPAVILDKATGQYRNFWDFVTEMCQDASEFLTEETGRSFVPFRYTYDIVLADILPNARNGRIPLPDDLLTVNTFDFDGTAIDVTTYRVYPSSETPIRQLILSTTALTGTTVVFGSAFSVSGIWGYVTNLSQAWALAQQEVTLANGTVTSLVVTTGTSVNYETLQYLKLEDEYLQITGIDLDTDTLTLLRGVNGTEGAAHTDVPMYQFVVKQDIAKAATELAVYYYTRRTPVGNIQLPDGSVVTEVFPLSVSAALKRYRPMKYSSVTPALPSSYLR